MIPQHAESTRTLRNGNRGTTSEKRADRIDTAGQFKARKNIAVAHRLRAEIALSRGAAAETEIELHSALELLRGYPVPILEWKVLAVLGRLHSVGNNPAGARSAFSRAAVIVNRIASNCPDDKLRATFLDSDEVREVLSATAP